MFDFLRPKILATVESPYSGSVKVVKSGNDVYLATGPLTQSGRLVGEVWSPALNKYGQSGKTWLILGLAGGTIAKYIADRLAPQTIVGVEIDPVMIDLGKTYLGLDHIPNLTIVIQDAREYVAKLATGFDYILVDMYFGDQLPGFVYDPQFLKQLKTHGTVVIFNHLFYDPAKKTAARELIDQLRPLYPQITLVRKLTNLLIVCGQNRV